MQYQSECLSALKSIANIHKPFEGLTTFDFIILIR